ncbi:hypothetical protein L2E82_49187 [Cichorium intybus]|uniref:Uncharacterized protein n=1 Tax=Cichorium intybus TaxID=13427 RepID=A0ACB8YZ08_CICIN|nr:hypothetical protein L2E82_49187 [Cichorium intybus]
MHEYEMLPGETDGRSEKTGRVHGEWKEVRRKSSKNYQRMSANHGVITYYVSNLPNGVNKLKIKRAFEPFGKIVDVYTGGKRDKSGSIFAFVRFEGVGDAKALEDCMCRVRCEYCILNVNIARYQKQSVVGPNVPYRSSTHHPPPPSPPQHNPQPNPTLVEDAKAFYVDESNWSKWFRWLKPGFNDIVEFERFAWVCIHGVPVRYRSQENYERIAGAFGKPCESFGGDWNTFDLATGYVCILTKSWKIINGEIDIALGTLLVRVGVIEFERDWTPFDKLKDIHPRNIYPTNDIDLDEEKDEDDCENDYFSDPCDEENSEDDEGGISATWERLPEKGDDVEDGKIIEDACKAADEVRSPVCENAKGPSGARRCMKTKGLLVNIRIKYMR